MIKVLNLGAGVQSSCLLLRAIHGEIEKPDWCLFADTQWEPQHVYDHLRWLRSRASEAEIPIIVVTAGNLRDHAVNGYERKKAPGRHYVGLPLHTLSINGESSGLVQQRQCTRDYKIRPITRKIKDLLGLERKQRWPTEVAVEQWFGITGDEMRRMRHPKAAWSRYRYPFVFDQLRWKSGRYESRTAQVWTRQDCLDWLKKHYPTREFPRSACIGCPYHNNAEWRRIKQSPAEWESAVEADRAIRVMSQARRTDLAYLHHDRVPLEEADLTINDKRPEQRSVFALECQGMCGV